MKEEDGRERKSLARSSSSINCKTKLKENLEKEGIHTRQITHRILEISLAFVTTIPFETTSVPFHSSVLHHERLKICTCRQKKINKFGQNEKQREM